MGAAGGGRPMHGRPAGQAGATDGQAPPCGGPTPRRLSRMARTLHLDPPRFLLMDRTLVRNCRLSQATAIPRDDKIRCGLNAIAVSKVK